MEKSDIMGKNTMKIYQVAGSREPAVIKAVLQNICDKSKNRASAAKKCGCSKWTLYTWIRKYDIQMPDERPRGKGTRGKRGSYIDWAGMANLRGFDYPKHMINYYKRAYPVKEAARLLGVSETTWRNKIKEK